ncbi:MAG: hypothetical protein KGM98_08365 [Bacteroidota bacterium]|nr:hypothetical protein [Bacteroidota bacterium]
MENKKLQKTDSDQTISPGNTSDEKHTRSITEPEEDMAPEPDTEEWPDDEVPYDPTSYTEPPPGEGP